MNPTPPPPARRWITPAVALVLIVLTFGLARFPSVSPVECQHLAARFKFEKMPILEVTNHPPYQTIRAVHPSLQRIAAWICALGASAALADLDGDGLPNDLCSIDPRTELITVAPVPGSGQRYAPFTLNVSPLPYDAATTSPKGVLIGDFNEDGLLDVLVYFWGRTPVMFLQQKSGAQPAKPVALAAAAFTPTELTTSGERWFSNAAIEADLDGDGHVDLMIGNYFQDGAHILDANAGGVEVMHEGKAKALNGGKKHIFLSAGAPEGGKRGTLFREVTGTLDEGVEHGWTLAMGAVDIDGDGLPEVYFSNDFGPDRLLHNESTPGHLKFRVCEGRRHLTDPKSCVLGCDSFKGMGCDFGDINGDGIPDIYVSNIATKYGLTESHFLWESTGEVDAMKHGVAPYVQASERLGLSRSGWAWDCRLADFDNDGVLEAIQAVGFIKGKVNRWPELQSLGTSNSRIVHDPRLWPNFKPGADLSGHELNPFFVRGADGRYYDIGPAVGFTEPMVTKGIALADTDGDGRLDFVFANQWEPSYYYHNTSPSPGGFLGLHLLLPAGVDEGTALRERAGHPAADLHGRPAYGAHVSLVLADGRKYATEVDGGTGHSGRRSPDVHIGLGKIAPETKLNVDLRWRDGGGQLQRTTLVLVPGWHTVLLGKPAGAQIASTKGSLVP